MTIRRCISDLETNGFLETVTTVHCAVLIDIDTGEAKGFGPNQINEYLDLLSTYDEVWGHNWIKFDEEVLRKLYPQATLPRGMDTMVLSRLVHPDIKATDFIRAKNWREFSESEEQAVLDYEEGRTPRLWTGPKPPPFPSKMIGSYSLAAWGYRLGEHKGDFDGGDWQTFSQEMFDYMMQDGAVTLLLFQKMMAHEPSPQSIDLEHRIARLCWQIEQNGFPFNEKAAVSLTSGKPSGSP
jgi:DNA polymerase-1